MASVAVVVVMLLVVVVVLLVVVVMPLVVVVMPLVVVVVASFMTVSSGIGTRLGTGTRTRPHYIPDYRFWRWR